jgi:hypothetical protein
MTTRKKAEKQIKLPKAVSRADKVRARLAQLGIEERDVNAAVLRARKVTSKGQFPLTF